MSDLTWWKSQAGRFPLLTPEQEVLYGTAIRRWQDDPDPSEAVIRRGRRAREKMINANLRLVINVVTGKYAFAIPPRGCTDPLDLIQEANIGLNRAAEKYDPTKGYRFTTYAYFWIRQSINRFLSMHSRSIRLPGSLAEQVSKLRTYHEDLRNELGRQPRPAEIAERAEMTVERMQEILMAWQPVLSMEHRLSEDLILGDSIPAPEMEPPDEDLELLAERMAWRMEDLNAQQREILSAGWGLGGREIEPQETTAARLGGKRSWVGSVKARAMATLRQERGQRPPAEPANWEEVELCPPSRQSQPSPPHRLKRLPIGLPGNWVSAFPLSFLVTRLAAKCLMILISLLRASIQISAVRCCRSSAIRAAVN